jgi:hypothetical protein
MRQFSPRDKDKTAYIYSSTTKNTKLAIFIHGFNGNFLTTWGKLPDMLYQHADSDKDLAQWDYLFMGYDTGNVETYLDIAQLICSQWNLASAGKLPYQ